MTIGDALARVATERPERGLHFRRRAVHRDMTWGEVRECAAEVAAGLHARFAPAPGERIGVLYATSPELVSALFGVIAAGCVPVALAPPPPFGSLRGPAERLVRCLEQSRARLLIAPAPVAAAMLRELPAGAAPPAHIDVASLSRDGSGPWAAAAPEDVAFVQYTSGSTRSPRGVAITHAQLLFCLDRIGRAYAFNAEDVMAGWLPLAHDLGLVSMLFGSVYWGFDLHLIDPLDFARQPAAWLRLISESGATISTAPPSAYLHCATAVTDDQIGGIDLSAWRGAAVGAEMIRPEALRRFAERFAGRGFRAESFAPGYGLAEATLTVSMARPRQGMRSIAAERKELDRALVHASRGAEAIELCSVGAPLGDVEIAIAGAVRPGDVGEILVRGASVMLGYENDPTATASALRDGWLHTGDLGCFDDGELIVTGRIKDLIAVSGRNVYAHDVEACAAAAAGVAPWSVAAFGYDGAGAEELVLLIEGSEGDPGAISSAVFAGTGIAPVDIVAIRPGSLPRTTSGKTRRAACAALYEELRS